MQDVRKIHADIKAGGVKKIILDTDTYNEIDDQFAISYALKAEETICLKALYAAPLLIQLPSVKSA